MYKKMYLILFNKITDALDVETLNECKEILKQAQIEAEEYCISSNEEI